jgi:phage baseplate assembly protein W
MNPTFGCELKKFIFEGITDLNLDNLRISLINSISIFIPEITVTDISFNPDEDSNILNLNVEYFLNISETPDQVTVQFQ